MSDKWETLLRDFGYRLKGNTLISAGIRGYSSPSIVGGGFRDARDAAEYLRGIVRDDEFELRFAAAEDIPNVVSSSPRPREDFPPSMDYREVLRIAGAAYERACAGRDPEAGRLLEAYPYCDYCSTQKPRAEVGTYHGLSRCYECEAKDPDGWHNDTNSQYEAQLKEA
ncbi:MAG: hypothetical protein ACJ74Q_15580 [Pyrinomonadaceae bacterium]